MTISAATVLQRPPRVEHFTDRKDELVQLLTELTPGNVATLCGPGGIGNNGSDSFCLT